MAKGRAGQKIALRAPTRQKYGNRKVLYGGVVFDSAAEGRRWLALLDLLREGKIANLEPHPRYVFEVNGVRIGSYRPDFRYIDTATGETVIEDVKSRPTKTEAYGMRKRCMRAFYGVEVKEVLDGKPV